MDVLLTAESFISIVASAVEGFKNEVGGLLFGDRYPTSNKAIIQQAIPLLTAERKPSSVHYHPIRTSRVLALWDNLTIYWPLGSFHSHPERGDTKYTPEPSESNKKDIQKNEIELIISIWEAKRRDPLTYTQKEKWISGSVGKYYIQLAGWFCNNEKAVIPVELWCPYIHVINLGYEIGITGRPGRLFAPETVTQSYKLRKLRRLIKKYELRVFRKPNEWKAEPILKEIKQVLKIIQKENRAS